MSGENENSIGTARAYLDIDTSDWDTAVARAKNSAAGLGSAAEEAFDKATGAQKRAATQLLQYVTAQGQAGDAQKVLNALMKGVPVDIATAAAAALDKQRQATTDATAAQSKLNEEIAKQAIIDKERAAQYAQNAQLHYNQLLGVNTSAGPNLGRRAEAEEAFTVGQDAVDAAKVASVDALAKSMREADDATVGMAKAQRAQSAFTAEQIAQIDALHAANGKQVLSTKESAAAIQAQKDALTKLLGQIDPSIKKLEQLDNAQAALNSALKAGKISSADYAAYSATLEKTRSEVKLTSGEFTKLNFNTAQARREYGYLVKDIATGQWGRFAQSAGSLANNVGLFGLAMSPIGAAVAGVGAIIAGVTVILVKHAKAWDELNVSAAKGDGIAGGVAQLDALATTLGDMKGNSLADAHKAIEALASSGLLFGRNFELAAQAATDWASVTGEASTKVTSSFEAIAKDPMKAILDGTVRVTAAQYDQIDALLKVGNTQEAVNQTIKIYFDQMENRSDMVKKNLSGWAELWINVRGVTQDATSWVGEYFDKMAKGIANIDKIKPSKDWGWVGTATSFYLSPSNAFHDAGAAQAKSEKESKPIDWITGGQGGATPPTTLTVAQLKIQSEIEKKLDDSGTAAQKYASQVKLLNGQLNALNDTQLKSLGIQRDGDQYGGSGYDKLLTSMKKRAGLDKKVSVAPEDAAIKRDAETQQAAIAAQTQFIQGQYTLRQISMEAYYEELKALAKQSGDVAISSLNKQIAVEQAHGNNAEKIAALQSQIATERQKEQNKEAQLDIQEAEAMKKRIDAIDAYKEGLDAQLQALQRNLDAMVARVGMGQQEYEIAQKLNEAYNQQADALAKIDKQFAKGSIDAIERDAERNDVMSQTVDKITAIKNAYTQLNTKELDVFNGMHAAFADFSQQSMQLSSNLQSVWKDGLGSIGDAAAKAATGVGTSFKDMERSMEATAIKALTNAAVTKFIELLASMFGGGAYTGLTGNGTGGYGMQTQTTFNAKGNVYSSPDLASHMNSIVSSPTLFKFAKGGALGMMGEAGKEAIMPLSKDSNGVLGVKSYGGGSGTPIVNVSIQNAPQGADVKSRQNSQGGVDIDIIFKQVDKYMAGGISDGTSLTSRAIAQRSGR